MFTPVIEIFAFLGKLALFFLIIAVIVKSIRNHGNPKVDTYDLLETIVFNLIIVVVYTLAGILTKFHYGLLLLALFLVIDISMSIKFNGMTKFSTYNAYKSGIIMTIYFFALYLVGFWSPILTP